MNSEKVKEIKKALKCCSEGKCEKCLIGKKDIRKCVDILLKDTLTIINELESENERLTTENVNYYGAREQTIEDLAEIINKQKDRIAELEKENRRNNESVV